MLFFVSYWYFGNGCIFAGDIKHIALSLLLQVSLAFILIRYRYVIPLVKLAEAFIQNRSIVILINQFHFSSLKTEMLRGTGLPERSTFKTFRNNLNEISRLVNLHQFYARKKFKM